MRAPRGRARTHAQAFTWRPSNGCELSPLSLMPPAMWHTWSTGLEASAGPTLFVGDEHLAQLYYAYRTLTNGAPHAKPVPHGLNTGRVSPPSTHRPPRVWRAQCTH
jgi:hypothetical protein